MSQLVTITTAARTALATWLVAELAPVAGGDGVVIEPRWFEVDRKLPPRSISIIDAGPRKIEWTDPEQIIVTNTDPGFVEVTWGLGYVEQRIQLDVWAPSDVELDDIMARLDISLNAGARALAGASSNAEPCGIGLLLAMHNGWEPGTVDFTFDEPNVDQTADAANQSEWRATYRGVANARLVQKATSPKLARIIINQRLSAGDIAPEAPADLTTTVDADTPADA